MDLHALTQTIRRHKLAMIPALLLAVAGIGYVVAVKAPTYQAKSSYILLPGAPTPTPAQIAQDPSLTTANVNNPLTEDGSLSTVVDALADSMSSDSAAAALSREGVASGSYTVTPDTIDYGAPPIVEITAEAITGAAATNTAEVVGAAMQKELATMQAAEGTKRAYWITSLELAHPNVPTTQLSGKLRDLVAVLAASVVLLFVIVSILNAREEGRRRALAPEPSGKTNRWAVNGFGVKPEDSTAAHVHEVVGSGREVFEREEERGQPVARHLDSPLNPTDSRRWAGRQHT